MCVRCMKYVMMRNLLTIKTWNLDVITEHESRKKNKAAGNVRGTISDSELWENDSPRRKQQWRKITPNSKQLTQTINKWELMASSFLAGFNCFPYATNTSTSRVWSTTWGKKHNSIMQWKKRIW